MPIINVPQGYSARYLKKLIPVNGIKGLYTGDFSACKIVLLVGTGEENKGKMILMHIDGLTSYIGGQLYKSDITWLDLPFEVVIFSRKGQGDWVLQNVTNFFSQLIPKEKITIKELDEIYDGVCVSFSDEKDIKPYKIELLKDKPSDLLCHPLEQRAYTVKKLYGMLGLRAILKENAFRDKAPWEFTIFDSTKWTLLNENNLNINISQEITKEEMRVFNSKKSFDEISIELKKLINKIKEENLPLSYDTIEESIIEVAGHLQFYLHDYNYGELHNQNLNIMKEDMGVAKVYQDMGFYELQKKKRNESRDNLLKLKEKGTQHFNKREYEAAGSLYQEVFLNLPLYCLETDPELANIGFNLGLVAYQQGLSFENPQMQQGYYMMAEKLLSQCLRRRIDNNAGEQSINKVKSALEKVKAALQECEDILKVSLNGMVYKK